MSHALPQGMYIIGKTHFDTVYPAPVRARIATMLNLITHDPNPELLGNLENVEVILSGWGAPHLTGEVLDRMPRLRLVLHAAGSLRNVATDEAWSRGIRFVSAAAINALPVAEFTLSQVIFSLKDGWRTSRITTTSERLASLENVRGVAGATVGIVSLGLIGREVVSRLRHLDVRCIGYDPHIDPARARSLGVQLVGLEELFERSDVVSLHTPLLDSTRHMFGAHLLRRMRSHATLINTARGGLIPTDELVTVLRERPDLMALLDVTDPEPLPSGHPLYSLENVVLTPHIAGSLGSELGSLGGCVASELERYLTQQPLLHELNPDTATLTA